MQKASLGKRFLAYLVDAVIGSCPIVLVLICGGTLMAIVIPQNEDLGAVVGIGIGLFYLLGIAWAIGYLLLRDFLGGGRSFGKKALGLNITVEGGGKVGLVTSLLRNITLVVPFVNFVDLVMVFIDDKGQRLGEKIAKTQVVG